MEVAACAVLVKLSKDSATKWVHKLHQVDTQFNYGTKRNHGYDLYFK